MHASSAVHIPQSYVMGRDMREGVTMGVTRGGSNRESEQIRHFERTIR